MQYRKKPVVIEAFKFVADHTNTHPTVPDWFVDAVCAGLVKAEPTTILIKTLEGVMRADPGDWIIRGIKGEIYPCKPDIFAGSYDPVASVDPTGASAPINSIGGPADVPALDMPAREERFRKELESLLNSHSRENGSNTPDFILAQFLCGVLAAWDAAVMRRSEWYGGKDRIGG